MTTSAKIYAIKAVLDYYDLEVLPYREPLFITDPIVFELKGESLRCQAKYLLEGRQYWELDIPYVFKLTLEMVTFVSKKGWTVYARVELN